MPDYQVKLIVFGGGDGGGRSLLTNSKAFVSVIINDFWCWCGRSLAFRDYRNKQAYNKKPKAALRKFISVICSSFRANLGHTA